MIQSTHRSLGALAALVTVVLGLLVTGAGRSDGDPARPGPSAGAAVAVSAAATADVTRLMARLGERRAAAWLRGDAALVSRVFVPGSRPWVEERRLLRAYTGRGLRVRGLSLTVKDASVIGSRPGRIRVLLVDRLPAAVAVGRDGRRYRLPRDSPTRHVVTLKRSGGRWRISAVQVVGG